MSSIESAVAPPFKKDDENKSAGPLIAPPVRLKGTPSQKPVQLDERTAFDRPREDHDDKTNVMEVGESTQDEIGESTDEDLVPVITDQTGQNTRAIGHAVTGEQEAATAMVKSVSSAPHPRDYPPVPDSGRVEMPAVRGYTKPPQFVNDTAANLEALPEEDLMAGRDDLDALPSEVPPTSEERAHVPDAPTNFDLKPLADDDDDDATKAERPTTPMDVDDDDATSAGREPGPTLPPMFASVDDLPLNTNADLPRALSDSDVTAVKPKAALEAQHGRPSHAAPRPAPIRNKPLPPRAPPIGARAPAVTSPAMRAVKRAHPAILVGSIFLIVFLLLMAWGALREKKEETESPDVEHRLFNW